MLSDGSYGIIKSIKVEKLSKPETTYNFEVEDFHTYFVGTNEVLVHNACTKVNIEANVYGKPHGSTEHQARIMGEVQKMQASGKYSDIYLNKALKTVGLNGSQRPDIIGKMLNGTFDAIEVASKTQTTTSMAGALLSKKVAIMKAANPSLIVRDIIWLFG